MRTMLLFALVAFTGCAASRQGVPTSGEDARLSSGAHPSVPSQCRRECAPNALECLDACQQREVKTAEARRLELLRLSRLNTPVTPESDRGAGSGAGLPEVSLRRP